MAAKRLFDGDDDQPNQKRMKNRPSFASVIRDVVMANFFENFCSSLEPMLRRVVSEEVENGLRQRCMSSVLHCPSLRTIQQGSDHHLTSSLQLEFSTRLSLTIFTSTKIVDADNNPLRIILNPPPPYAIKLEIVVLDGDFPKGDTWTSDEFAKNIVKERAGKRPLLTGDLNLTVRDGVADVGDLEFTDNSSWIRSRKFRLGARVLQNGEGGVMIREAISNAFVVKDHRGELYKKHHPPALEDDVWRLEKIGKRGVFHEKLASHGINTVQDFLKLFTVDSSKLRKILGSGMSEKMWEATLKHAKTCLMGTKLYRYRGNDYTLTLNPICQLVKADISGQVYYERDLKRMHTAYIQSLVKDAYAKWNSLEEVDGLVQETPLLLTQGIILILFIFS
ncbi:hypothetical protein CDL12_21700 [Handroanthus impetiginosus]|uniref:Calmodulin-binding protein n=1 Tax=Handroanthus impetiginosus TaxID=429701 RepID=A0A2G9GKC9_9LAMI|nr:hypothetical protein CDL12_21700 [Handroanthus impetiginosus]